LVKDTPFEAGAPALGCIGRRTGSWVRPRPMRKSLGGMACSDFVGVSGVSLGLLDFGGWMVSSIGIPESDSGDEAHRSRLALRRWIAADGA